MEQAGIFSQLERVVRQAYDRIIGLALADLSVDGCITKAPVADRSLAAPRPTGTNAA